MYFSLAHSAFTISNIYFNVTYLCPFTKRISQNNAHMHAGVPEHNDSVSEAIR